jgi:hypothetical protein
MVAVRGRPTSRSGVAHGPLTLRELDSLDTWASCDGRHDGDTLIAALEIISNLALMRLGE